MFETLGSVLQHYGQGAKAIIWAHNSHVGNAAATEMSARGETNIGELCRKHFGDAAYAIGFGTDRGTVAAASDWDGPMEIKAVRPSLRDSYENICHQSEAGSFFLSLRHAARSLKVGLSEPRLQRAIGVVYRPETERASHYFQAVLPEQFDEYIWFDQSSAVTPFDVTMLEGLPDTYPFGL
jgi:protein-L-isoaspartate(D-aspartate) O-methyltransferase